MIEAIVQPSRRHTAAIVITVSEGQQVVDDLLARRGCGRSGCDPQGLKRPVHTVTSRSKACSAKPEQQGSPWKELCQGHSMRRSVCSCMHASTQYVSMYLQVFTTSACLLKGFPVKRLERSLPCHLDLRVECDDGQLVSVPQEWGAGEQTE